MLRSSSRICKACVWRELASTANCLIARWRRSMRCGERLDWMRKVGESLPPSTTPSGCSLSNSRRDLSSSSTSTIYASTSSEEYSSYDSHDSHSRFIENRSYGTVTTPTSGARHLERETPAPARYYSTSASSCATAAAVSAASLQPDIPYYHGSLPMFEAAGPSTASSMISVPLC
eukprot:scaffold3586_cov276-Ochromonas_danica.AAC.1